MGDNNIHATRLVDQDDYDIRYTNQGDLPCLKKWLGYPEVRRWYPVSTDKDVGVMAKNWVGFCRYRASLTAVYKGEPVGMATLFLMPYRKLIHHCLTYFIVDPERSRSGIGTSMLRNITHLGKNYFRFEMMHIELYEGCAAISIMIKEGYYLVYRQEHFIKEGDDKYLARMVYEIKFTSEKGGVDGA